VAEGGGLSARIRGAAARRLVRVADALDRRSLGPVPEPEVERGEGVTVGPDVRLLGPGRIVLGDGCWIGQGARVLPGVSIGVGAVVRPYTVVHEDVAAGAVVHGNPARPV
jgi:carbonic anhydrase/acetyltransferase-like protein (isoleucine patch superfamily)